MKEKFLRVKRLSGRKSFASDESEYKVEPYLEVVKSIDSEGAFNHIQDYINGARECYSRNEIEYDEIKLYPRSADKYSYAIANKVKPIQDILRVYVNAVGYENDGTKSTINPDDIGHIKNLLLHLMSLKLCQKQVD